MDRIAVYTCITGAYDRLRPPPAWDGCDFICFTDNPYARSSAWQMRLLPEAPHGAARKSRLPKILPHRFLLEYSMSVWMDANVICDADLSALARQALADDVAVFFRHPERDCVFDEAEVCSRLNKDGPAILQRQAGAYRQAGLPPHAGLYECTVMLRRHRDPGVVALMEQWWQEVLTQSARDQISLPFVAWRSGVALKALPSRTPSGQPLYRRRTHSAQRRQAQKRGTIKKCEMAVLSFPKSGRTWLRHFLAAYRNASGDNASDIEFGAGSLDGRGIVFDHEYMEIYQDCAETPELLYPKLLSRKRVALLVRDPRAVTISYYYHKRLREGVPLGGLIDFVHSPIYGIERQAIFVNLLLDWYEAKSGDKLLLRYEALRTEPRNQLSRFAEFVFPDGVDQPAFDCAVEASGFETMQQSEIEMSRSGSTGTAMRRGVAQWNGDINALKARKADLMETRQVFWPALWQEISALPHTRRLLQRLEYPLA